jgi:hypothetical protein
LRAGFSHMSEGTRNNKGQFLRGHAPIPGGGRKLGSRNKLASQFSDDLYAKWRRYGPSCLDTLAKAGKDGDIGAAKAFVGAVGGHLPKEAVSAIFSVDVSATSVDAFSTAYALALKLASGTAPRLIEHNELDDE